MGDARHKKSPPPAEEEEEITWQFVTEVRAALARNEESNKKFRRKKEERSYLISNQAELGDAVGTDKNNIRKMIGPVRNFEKWKFKPGQRSGFVRPICRALGIDLPMQLTVSAEIADTLRKLLQLPNDERNRIAAEIDSTHTKVISGQSGHT